MYLYGNILYFYSCYNIINIYLIFWNGKLLNCSCMIKHKKYNIWILVKKIDWSGKDRLKLRKSNSKKNNFKINQSWLWENKKCWTNFQLLHNKWKWFWIYYLQHKCKFNKPLESYDFYILFWIILKFIVFSLLLWIYMYICIIQYLF